MYRLSHSAPDPSNTPDPSTSDLHHYTTEQSSTHLQPVMASRTHRNTNSQEKHDHGVATPAYSYPSTPGTLESGNASNNSNARSRKTASRYIHEGISYDPSNAKEDYLQMAKDDVPDNKVSSASSTAGIISAHSAARTLLGGPFLPPPHWCLQDHTLVSAFFSPEAPNGSHAAFQIRH